MTAPRELRTTRLLLRSFQQADIPTLTRLAGAREIAASTLNIPHPYAEADARSFIAEMENSCRGGYCSVFAITIATSRDLCGAVGLTISPAHQHAELGYWIGVPYWGQGFATEAARAVVAFGFETLRLHRIYAYHFAGNVSSRRVLEKLGMLHEGHSREHIRKWSDFVDLEMYGLLARDVRAGK